MNCEQVKELLSAYLDDTLALGDPAGSTETAHLLRLNIAAHLENCPHCRAMLADYRHFDALLAQLPRVSPSPALRDRIFSSPEYLELTAEIQASRESGVADTFKRFTGTDDIDTAASTTPYRSVRRDTPGRPHLIALPGGRHSSSSRPKIHSSMPTQLRLKAAPPMQKRRSAWGLRAMQMAIAAIILLTLGVGSLIGRNLWLQKNTLATGSKAITPPAAPAQHGPLSAGMRFVFLRDGMLFSTPADGTPAEQLTPKGVIVATNWAVRPPLPGRPAGDLLAYIDLERALIHTIRSDGLSDRVVQQPLLKAGVAPSSVWDTATGEAILNSLSWSKDGSMLAFVADPKGTGSTSLYILTIATSSLEMVSLPMKGSVSHPVWSPDGMRVAFELANNGTTSILDYNTQNHGLLVITNRINSQTYPNDMILTLDWTADTNTPAITWSVGVIGHVHSIWLHHVGFEGTAAPQSIVQGDFTQAIYSRNGDGVGSWLLVASFPGHPTNLWRIDATPKAYLIALTSRKQVNFAQWSPDGTQVDYLDNITSGVGTLHVVNVATFVDSLIAPGVTNEPTPAWSEDGQQLIYSTTTQIVVANMQDGKKLQPLNLHGQASAFIWSVTSMQQLVVALSDGQEGVYLVDTLHNSTRKVDPEDISGSILWTEVP